MPKRSSVSEADQLHKLNPSVIPSPIMETKSDSKPPRRRLWVLCMILVWHGVNLTSC